MKQVASVVGVGLMVVGAPIVRYDADVAALLLMLSALSFLCAVCAGNKKPVKADRSFHIINLKDGTEIIRGR